MSEPRIDGTDERVERLAWHFHELSWQGAEDFPTDVLRHDAAAILRDPQGHIDALVEAGVLERCAVTWGISAPNMAGQMEGPGYRVAPPKACHVHDPFIAGEDVFGGTDNLIIRCRDMACDWAESVPNELPIVVPAP